MTVFPVFLRGFTLALAACLLAGCNSWTARRETISYQAGDAIAWNKAVHTIDPWPAASRDTNIPTSGRRIARAIDLYENGAQPAAGDADAIGAAKPIAAGTP